MNPKEFSADPTPPNTASVITSLGSVILNTPYNTTPTGMTITGYNSSNDQTFSISYTTSDYIVFTALVQITNAANEIPEVYFFNQSSTQVAASGDINFVKAWNQDWYLFTTVIKPTSSGTSLKVRFGPNKTTVSPSSSINVASIGSYKVDASDIETFNSNSRVYIKPFVPLSKTQLPGYLYAGAGYIIRTAGGVVTAYPTNGSLSLYTGTDAYSVIQSAATALTPSGSLGTGGGHIYIAEGAYNLSNEVVITGWESGGNQPNSQLIIEGAGYATQINQYTANKNGFVVKNDANVVFKNFSMYVDPAAKSGILGDNNGSSEISMWGGGMDNIYMHGGSSTQPLLYLKNFISMNFGYLDIENTNGGNAIQLENVSSIAAYGNSNFQYIKAYATSTYGVACVYINSTVPASFNLNMLTFQNLECFHGYYGVKCQGGTMVTYNLVDIEATKVPIYLMQYSKHNTFLGGYIYGTGSTDTLIKVDYLAASNTFSNLYLDNDANSFNVYDQVNYNRPDAYINNTFGSFDNSKVNIAAANNTFFSYRGTNEPQGNTVVNIPSNPTSVNGSSSGTAVFTQNFQGVGTAQWKRVMVQVSALSGTASYTYYTPFTTTPVVTFATAGITASALTTTATTISATGQSGYIIIEGN